jgi:hypothetical protein
MSSHNPNLDLPVEPSDSAEARMRLALGLGTRPASSGQPSTTSGPAPASHDSGRQRRRFAQDGDVPVVMLHRGRDGDAGGENKLAALTADLREERAARLKLERALDEANVLVSSLKTKLKHAEMSLEEKLSQDGESRVQRDAALVTEREAREQAETRAADATLALSILERKLEAAAKQMLVQPPGVDAAAASPGSDLFGEAETSVASPAAPRRRMTKKTIATETRPEQTLATTSKPAPDLAGDDGDKPIEWWLPSFRAARKIPVRRKRATS